MRGARFGSEGWTPEGKIAKDAARNAGVCVICSLPITLKSDRARAAHKGECADILYERFYRGWTPVKRAVLRRVRSANDGAIRCEACGGAPTPAVRKQRYTYEQRALGGRVAWRKVPIRSVLGPLAIPHVGYEFDHTREIASGGDPLDPANVRLLCLRCHRRKTRAFNSARRSRAKRRPLPEDAPWRVRPLDGWTADQERTTDPKTSDE